MDINQTTTGFISTSFDIIKARICNDIIQKVEGVTWDRKKTILFANDSAANIRSELGISSNRPLIGVVGRLVPQKNHQRLLETMAIIKQSRPAVMCLIVGDGQIDKHLKQQSAS